MFKKIFWVLVGVLLLSTCTCNLRADDTALVQSLINSGGEFDSTRVYYVHRSVQVPADTEVDGNGCTIKFVSPSGIPYEAGFEIVGSNVRLSGFIINAPDAAVAVLIDAPYLSDIWVEDLEIFDAWYGVMANISRFNAAEREDPSAYQTRLHINYNIMRDLKADGITFNSPVFAKALDYRSGDETLVMRDVEAIGNDISIPCLWKEDDAFPFSYAYGFGISVAGVDGFIIARNVILLAKWHGVHIEDRAKNGKVYGNIIQSVLGGTYMERHTQLAWRQEHVAGIWALDCFNVFALDNYIFDSAGSGIVFLRSTTVGAAGNGIGKTSLFGVLVQWCEHVYIGAMGDYGPNKLREIGATNFEVQSSTRATVGNNDVQ